MPVVLQESLSRRHGHHGDPPVSPNSSGELTPPWQPSHATASRQRKQHISQRTPQKQSLLLALLTLLLVVCCLLTSVSIWQHFSRVHGVENNTVTPEETDVTGSQRAAVPWADIARHKKHLKQHAASEGIAARQGPSIAELVDQAQNGPWPIRLKYPVLWNGAFFSRSGYGTEAVSYIAGLLQGGLVDKRDLWIAQCGDYAHDAVINSMEPAMRELFSGQEYSTISKTLAPEDRDRPLIVVCHSFPDCWRTPQDDLPKPLTFKRAADMVGDYIKYRLLKLKQQDNGCPCPGNVVKGQMVYHIGRSMFETEKLPNKLVQYANAVDEVWVPSDFNVLTFGSSGVDPAKLYALGQGINTTLFNPAAHQRLPLTSLEGALVTGVERPRRRQQQAGALTAALVTGLSASVTGLGAHRHLTQAEGGVAAGEGGAVAATSADSQQQQQKEEEGSHAHVLPGALRELTSTVSSSIGHLHASMIIGHSDHHQHGQRHQAAAQRRAAAADGEQQQQTGDGGQSQEVEGPEPFRFLSVFKWETRKGWDILFKAYAQEFGSDENVELHIITKEAFEKVRDFRQYVRRAIRPHVNATCEADLDLLPRVYVHSGYIPERLFPGVYKAADALVIPSHGEGWGRPQMEAMAMALPVIATNWSGTTAFLNDTVGYPIRVEGVVDVRETGPNAFKWFSNQRWAQPSVSHLRQLMRHVVDHREEAVAKGKAARVMVEREYSLQAIARKVLVQLLRVQARVDDLLNLNDDVVDGSGDEAQTASSGVEEAGSSQSAGDADGQQEEVQSAGDADSQQSGAGGQQEEVQSTEGTEEQGGADGAAAAAAAADQDGGGGSSEQAADAVTVSAAVAGDDAVAPSNSDAGGDAADRLVGDMGRLGQLTVGSSAKGALLDPRHQQHASLRELHLHQQQHQQQLQEEGSSRAAEGLTSAQGAEAAEHSVAAHISQKLSRGSVSAGTQSSLVSIFTHRKFMKREKK